jgi:Flp pilus assembly protein TadD
MKKFWTLLTLVGFFILSVGLAQVSAADAGIAPGPATQPAPAPAAVSNFNDAGAALYNSGAFGDAILEFNKQLEYNPEDVPALVNRGISYARRGEYKIAIENLFTALNIKNDNVIILKYIAAVYYLDREYKKSLDIFSRAATLANNDSEAITGKGCAFLAMGKNEEAATEFTRALYLTPGDIRSFIGRGMSLNASGKFEAAVSDLGKAASMSSNDPFIYLIRAEANAGNAGFSSAISDLNKACSLNYTAVCMAMKNAKTELAGAAGSFVLQYSRKGPDEELYDTSRKKLDHFYASKRSSEMRKYFIRQLRPVTN